ncbi:hypothetical protein [Lactiplantibacillus plantarum]|uniref:hypothetical protein n=1 Tax=Lactiplantibacillus plantarum TaxID=1590 RepID=UPI0007B556E3|nr:hypothetical protein [Lactiplantibacillus plantarum]
MKTIDVKLILNRPVRLTYLDYTYWEYTISESPFDPGTYGAHLSLGNNIEKHKDRHIEVYFPRHSMVSEEFELNGDKYKLRLINS